jgi:hypothetical protein
VQNIYYNFIIIDTDIGTTGCENQPNAGIEFAFDLKSLVLVPSERKVSASKFYKYFFVFGTESLIFFIAGVLTS